MNTKNHVDMEMKMKMAQEQEQKVQKAFVGAHLKASQLIGRLQQELATMYWNEYMSQVNWGRVGSMNYIVNQLSGAVDHLCGEGTAQGIIKNIGQE